MHNILQHQVHQELIWQKCVDGYKCYINHTTGLRYSSFSWHSNGLANGSGFPDIFHQLGEVVKLLNSGAYQGIDAGTFCKEILG